MITCEDFVQHLINGLNLGAIYALIALGYTMVYGVLQLINFAHSEVYMVGAFAAYYTSAVDESWMRTQGMASLCDLLGLCDGRLLDSSA